MSTLNFSYTNFKGKSSALTTLERLSPDFYETLDEAFESAAFKSIDEIKESSHKLARELETNGILELLGVTQDEATVLFLTSYELKGYGKESPQYVINRVLAEGVDSKLMAYRGYILHLLKALRKLKRVPTSGTTLYRGVYDTSLKFDEDHYRVGNILTWPAFTSTTLDEDVAYKFVRDAAQSIFFEIHGAFIGYSIKTFSGYPKENEVLLEPDTTFRVVSIQDDTKKPKVKRIVVEVLSTPLIIKDVVENFAKREAQLISGGVDNEKVENLSSASEKMDPSKINPLKMNISDFPSGTFKGKPSALGILERLSPDFYETLDKAFESAAFEYVHEIKERSHKRVRELAVNGTLEKLGINKVDAEALLSYTYEIMGIREKSLCYVVNTILAERNDNQLWSHRGYILHLLKALRKLRPIDSSTTTLYRGIDEEHLTFYDDHYKVGNIMTWPAFTSTTPNENIAYMFMQRAAQPIIFEIRGAFVGYPISFLSRFTKSDEEEVLLEPETTFRVVSIQDDRKNPKAKRIVVEVLSTPLIIKDVVENFAKREAQLISVCTTTERLSPNWRRITSPKGETFYYNIKTEAVQTEPPVMSMSDLPFSDIVGKPSAMSVFQYMPSGFYENLSKSFESASFKNFSVIKEKSQERVRGLERNGTLNKLKMASEEAEVLFSYTYEEKEKKSNTPCYIMNKLLAERNDNRLMAYRGYILHLLKALRKLEPVDPRTTTLYRGIDGERLTFDDKHYKVGNIMTWPAFTSTTPNESIAYKFSSKAVKPVIFEIHGAFVGYPIKPFSNFQKEEEVLLEPETTFRIRSIQDDTKDPKAKRIVVDVQPSPLMIKDAVEKFARNERNFQSPHQQHSHPQGYVQQNQGYPPQNYVGQTNFGPGSYNQAPMNNPQGPMNFGGGYNQAPAMVNASGSFGQMNNFGGFNQNNFNGNGYNPQFNSMGPMNSGSGYGQMNLSGSYNGY